MPPMGGELACRVPDALVEFANAEGPPPDELQQLWDATCPVHTPARDLPAAVDYAGRRKLFQACDLARLGLTEDQFAYASGRPLVAAMAHAWLLAGEVANQQAQDLAQQVAGEAVFVPPIEPDFDLLRLPTPSHAPGKIRRARVLVGKQHVFAGMTGETVTAVRRPADQGVLNERLEATYTLPALENIAPTPAPPNAPVGTHGLLPGAAVDADTRIGTVRNLLATYASPGTAIELVGQTKDGGLTTLPVVYATSRAAASFRLDIRHNGLNLWVGTRKLAPVEGCPQQGPTLCLKPGPYVSQLTTPVMSMTVADLLASYAPQRLRGHIPSNPERAPLIFQVDVADEFPLAFVLQTLEQLGTFAGQNPPTLALSLDFAPCLNPPAGMVCVPGGPAIVGNDSPGHPEEGPRREVVLSTFYIDKFEVTTQEFDACTEAGACRRRINGHQNIMKPFVGPDQPVVPIDWPRAQAYCAYRGKRLPSEWEWEKAARGPDGATYPWGDEQPSCERAQYRECAPIGCTPYPGFTNRWDCPVHNTKAVGSYPAGHYGIHEMAGNGYEWTASAGVESIAECGDACNGTDPLGKCDGAYPCEGLRMLRGGSWWWPKWRIRGSHRRVEKVQTHGHRLSARCVATSPVLASYPPAHLREQRPIPKGVDGPVSAATAAILATVEADPIEDKHICSAKVREEWGESLKRGGRSTTECRDPFPYIMPNEPRGHIWRHYFKNLGGGYLGVGSDQNYNYIAHARSQYAWVMDYDPRVVRQHLRLRAFILHADTPDEFVAKFAPENARSSVQLLREVYRDHPKKSTIIHGFTKSQEKLYAYLQDQQKPFRQAPEFGWLRNPKHFAYIKKMYTQGRLTVLEGDLLGSKAIATVSAALEQLGVPLRIYYSSNAPSAWGGDMTPAYRNNILAMPFDARSLILQTTNKGGFRQQGYWHHNVAWGLHVQKLLALPGYDNLEKLLVGRIPGDDGDLTQLGLPAQLPPLN